MATIKQAVPKKKVAAKSAKVIKPAVNKTTKPAAKKAAGERGFIPQIRSRHNTHDSVRGKIGRYPKRSIVRFGSLTPNNVAFPEAARLGKPIVEINPVPGVRNSANKKLMKECFVRAGVKTAPWYVPNNEGNGWKKVVGADDAGNMVYTVGDINFPVVSKHIYGSRGTGNKFHQDEASLKQWMHGKSAADLSRYILEEYFTGVREYRMHINKHGCFYTCRKMLKENTPAAERWYRNDDNSVWIMDTNPAFDKPVNWAAIEADCVKALAALNLDVAAFDIRVQSTKNKKGEVRENPDWILLESNSAPSFGKVTTEKYLAVLPMLIQEKM